MKVIHLTTVNLKDKTLLFTVLKTKLSFDFAKERLTLLCATETKCSIYVFKLLKANVNILLILCLVLASTRMKSILRS